MLKRMLLYFYVFVLMAFSFTSLNLYAESTLPVKIDMECQAYEDHTKDIVVFSHKSHAETYTKSNPLLFETGCGACHHDKSNEPLSLKPGEDVRRCIDCHTKPGRMPIKKKRAMRRTKLSKTEKKLKKIAYHAEALQYNCRDCHRSYNKKNNLKSSDKNAAPTRCNSCH